MPSDIRPREHFRAEKGRVDRSDRNHRLDLDGSPDIGKPTPVHGSELDRILTVFDHYSHLLTISGEQNRLDSNPVVIPKNHSHCSFRLLTLQALCNATRRNTSPSLVMNQPY